MFSPLNDTALDQLFRTARTYNAFSGEIDDATLHRLYDLLKFGPTAANACPARFVFREARPRPRRSWLRRSTPATATRPWPRRSP